MLLFVVQFGTLAKKNILSVIKVWKVVKYFAVAAGKICRSVLDQCDSREQGGFPFFICNDKVYAKSMNREIDMKV